MKYHTYFQLLKLLSRAKKEEVKHECCASQNILKIISKSAGRHFTQEIMHSIIVVELQQGTADP